MKTIKLKAIYFADMMTESQEDDCQDQIVLPLAKRGIEFEKIILIDMPPTNETYDVLFFDWGGASLGNDFMGSFCRHIRRDAELYPDRMYVMVSSFTEDAMKDALYGYELTNNNIFMNIEDFAYHLNSLK